jgi:hypothetical protein
MARLADTLFAQLMALKQAETERQREDEWRAIQALGKTGMQVQAQRMHEEEQEKLEQERLKKEQKEQSQQSKLEAVQAAELAALAGAPMAPMRTTSAENLMSKLVFEKTKRAMQQQEQKEVKNVFDILKSKQTMAKQQHAMKMSEDKLKLAKKLAALTTDKWEKTKKQQTKGKMFSPIRNPLVRYATSIQKHIGTLMSTGDIDNQIPDLRKAELTAFKLSNQLAQDNMLEDKIAVQSAMETIFRAITNPETLKTITEDAENPDQDAGIMGTSEDLDLLDSLMQ